MHFLCIFFPILSQHSFNNGLLGVVEMQTPRTINPLLFAIHCQTEYFL